MHLIFIDPGFIFCFYILGFGFYLHRKSEHPDSFNGSIPFAQTLCLCHVCSTNNEFQDSCDKLRTKLIERRYKQQEINEVIESTKTLDKKSPSKRERKKEVIECDIFPELCGYLSFTALRRWPHLLVLGPRPRNF